MRGSAHQYSHLSGETLRGKVISEGGTRENEDPILAADKDVPNIVLTNKSKDEVELGERYKVVIGNTEANVLFGEVVDEGENSDEPRNPSNSKQNFQVSWSMFGYEFTSETLADEQAAQDLKQLLEGKLDREIEVTRTR